MLMQEEPSYSNISNIDTIINKINNKDISSHSLSYFLIGNFDKSKEDKKNIIKYAIKNNLVNNEWVAFHLNELIYTRYDKIEILSHIN
jgi:hypothetical protein